MIPHRIVRRPLPRSLAWALAALGCLAALAFAVDAARGARALAAHSDEVLLQSTRLERKVIDLETGLRGYAITRDHVFLRPMLAAQRQIPDDLKALRRLVRGDAAQERRARELEAAVWTYARHWLVPALRLHRSDSALAAQMWAAIGRERMEAIRARFGRLEGAERIRRTALEARAQRYERGVLGLVAGLALLLVAPSALAARRWRRSSADLLAELEALRARGEGLAAELARRTELDPLTGVATRRAFVERLEQECAAARRHGGELSLVVVDVAGLARINAADGFDAGDRALAELAALCLARVRSADAVGRIGGDELALMLPRTPLRRARALAAELRAAARVALETGVASAGHDAAAGVLLAAAAPQPTRAAALRTVA